MKTSQHIKLQIVKAFVDNGGGGNAAAVLMDADDYTNSEKQKIAQAVGLSETVFISKSDIAEFKLDFFTPTRQIAHCGHATIAAFSYLSQIGKIVHETSSKETIDGTREIKIHNNMAFMEQRAPVFSTIGQHKKSFLKAIGVTENELHANAPIMVVSTGNAFAVIAVKDEHVLKHIKPDHRLIAELSENFDLVGCYVFCTQTHGGDRDANARMFAPRYGINEEPGTGMAAGPLACYLHEILGLKKQQYLIQQGWFMESPSPSLIIVDLELSEKGEILKLMAGGKGIPTDLRTVEI